jgi:hypothetical protein
MMPPPTTTTSATSGIRKISRRQVQRRLRKQAVSVKEAAAAQAAVLASWQRHNAPLGPRNTAPRTLDQRLAM